MDIIDLEKLIQCVSPFVLSFTYHSTVKAYNVTLVSTNFRQTMLLSNDAMPYLENHVKDMWANLIASEEKRKSYK